MFIINGIQWQVKLVPPNHPILLKENGEWTIGACDEVTKSIYLNWDLNLMLMRQVLNHEIAHAVMLSYNINLSVQEEELFAELFTAYGEEIINITNQTFSWLKEKRGS